MSTVPKIGTCLFYLSAFFQSSAIRIKLPYLPPCKVVCAKKVRIMTRLTRFCYFQPPHLSVSEHWIKKCGVDSKEIKCVLKIEISR
ncbi:hypothetical protein HanIR_Chr13g0655021 [Helianthus annuus]|nr:hypothetical protein HanIR_Chr13g0655021 [Helianthus annuus]